MNNKEIGTCDSCLKSNIDVAPVERANIKLCKSCIVSLLNSKKSGLLNTDHGKKTVCEYTRLLYIAILESSDEELKEKAKTLVREIYFAQKKMNQKLYAYNGILKTDTESDWEQHLRNIETK